MQSLVRVVVVFCVCINAVSILNADEPERLRFQGQTWVSKNAERFNIGIHRGLEAMQIGGGGANAVVVLEDSDFRFGSIELDLASNGRSVPTLALNVPRQAGTFDQISLNPWLSFDGEPSSRLRQGVVTQGKSASVIVNFYLGESPMCERDQWFHVRIEIDREFCRVFIDYDLAPAFVFGNSFHSYSGGLIGIRGSSGFVRNVKFDPTQDSDADGHH